ncbi:MAG: alanine racemase [Candidatus Cryosericum sp.]
MKTYSELAVSLDALEDNARSLKTCCDAAGVEVIPVLKGMRSAPEIVRACARGGLVHVADSRVENLVRLKTESGTGSRSILIRPPMAGEAEAAVKACDCIFVTERQTLAYLSDAARAHHRKVNVVPLIDVGERSDGMPPGQLVAFARYAMMLPGLHVAGVATSLGSFARVQATPRNHGLLVRSAQVLRDQLGLACETVSTGGTVALTLVEHGTMPASVTQIRVGEALLLGTSTAEGRLIPWLRQDTAVLRAEVIEVQEKQAEPEGLVRADIAGMGPRLRVSSKGMRRRAVLALGIVDTDLGGLTPMMDGAVVLGGSSDRVIVDITDGETEVTPGDVLEFRLSYAALARAAASPYVSVVYDGERD